MVISMTAHFAIRVHVQCTCMEMLQKMFRKNRNIFCGGTKCPLFHALCSTMREGDPLTFEGQRDHPVTTLKTDDETPNAEWNDVEIVAIDPVNTEL